MFKLRLSHAPIEPLEARIAPALAVLNPLADLIVGPGKTGADIDLSRLFDPLVTDNGHTIVTLQTNFDGDPNTPGVQASSPIVIELFDDIAPLSVQNFISYLTSSDPKANYTGTIFHRIFDFGATSESGRDIIQGGGFNYQTPATHIPTPFEVHNEYSEAYPNVRGTIAMAKTGLGPNTGTSEWFINTTDNTNILGGNNNGGFAVFGRVLQGLEVADGIAKLQTYNFSGSTGGTAAPLGSLNGAFTDLPLQNYNADPDSNPNTPAPLPSLDNVVRLTSLSKAAPPSGKITGVTYTVDLAVDIFDTSTQYASDLVGATITGSTLHLNYKAHAAGVVRVTVHGTDASSSSAADTFVVNLQPNLVASFAGDPFDGIVIGGDTKTANLIIGNTGGGWAVGNVNVKVYLSKVEANGVDTSGVLVEPGHDILIGDFANQSIDVAGGSTTTLVKNLQIPKQLVTTAGENYRVLVQVTPSDSVINERFSDDNVSFDSKVHVWENRFGTFTIGGFGTRTDAKLVYQEADGDVVQFSITKEGNGLLNFDGSLVDVAVVSPRPASVLTASIISGANLGGHDIDLRNIELLQYVQKVQMPQANLTGVFGAADGFGELTMANLTGPGLITIGKVPSVLGVNPTMTFKSVSDFSVESLSRIRLIRADQWIETDGTTNHITAPSIGNIAIRGNLEANIGMTTSEALGVFYVGGFFRNATLTTRADVNSVSVGGLDHANFFVGTKARPASTNDFAQIHSINSFIIAGVPGAAHSFIASNVTAAHIGSIVVRGLDPLDSPSKFGFVADAVRSYNRGGGPSFARLGDPQRLDLTGRYSLTIV